MTASPKMVKNLLQIISYLVYFIMIAYSFWIKSIFVGTCNTICKKQHQQPNRSNNWDERDQNKPATFTYIMQSPYKDCQAGKQHCKAIDQIKITIKNVDWTIDRIHNEIS